MMQMLYYVINNVHVDYAALIWEGLHSSLMHPTTNIPYPRFTKIVTDHILTMHPDISKRTNEPYYIVENDKTKVDIDSMVVDAMRKEQDRTRAELSLQVSNDVATNVPLQMTDNEQARNADFPLWLALMFKFKKSDAHVDPCIVDAFCKHDHKDQHDNEACPEGESIVKRQRTSENSNYTRGKSSSQAMEESNLSGSVIYGLELVPTCLINGDVELYWVINLASSLKLFL
ncbi:hypothetical protein Tco_0999031 [Tanacetum coccineum]